MKEGRNPEPVSASTSPTDVPSASQLDPPTLGIPLAVELGPRAASEGPLAGRYRILAELGRGGMGVVYRAFDRDLRRDVAMKVLDAGMGNATRPSDPDRADEADSPPVLRFIAEAQATAQLQHPGIVPVYEVGRDGVGRLFYTMKLVDGQTLTRLSKASQHGGVPTRFRLLQIFVEVCRTVAYAHARGIIHRDLKPSNIMVGAFDDVQVLDWGLAKVLRPKHSDAGIEYARVRPTSPATGPGVEEGPPTGTGQVLGTPGYMAPEQVLDPARVGPHADIYALGATLFATVVGKSPFGSGRFHEILVRQTQQPTPPLSRVDKRVPRELVAICARAMAREPGERYRDADALAADVQAFLEGRSVTASPDGSLRRLRKAVLRRPGLALASLVSLLLLSVSSLVGLSSVSRARSELADTLAVLRRTTASLDVSRQQSEVNARRARSRALVLGSQFNLDKDPMLALLLAREALGLADGPEPRRALRAALRVPERLRIEREGLAQAIFSPDGQKFLTREARTGLIEVFDLAGRSLAAFHGRGQPVSADVAGERLVHADFTADSRAILGWAAGRRVRAWDLQGRPLASVLDDQLPGAPLTFLADGSVLLVGSLHGDSCVVQSRSDGAQLRRFRLPGAVRGLDAQPNSPLLAVTLEDGAVCLLDIQTGAARHLPSTLHARDATLAATGDRVLIHGTASDGVKRSELWDSAGLLIRGALATQLEYSPGGRFLFEVRGQELRLVSTQTGSSSVIRAAGELEGTAFGFEDALVSLRVRDPLRRSQVTAELWATPGELEAAQRLTQLSPASSVTCAAFIGSQGIALGCEDGSVRSYEFSGEALGTFYHGARVEAIAFDALATRMLTRGGGRAVVFFLQPYDPSGLGIPPGLIALGPRDAVLAIPNGEADSAQLWIEGAPGPALAHPRVIRGGFLLNGEVWTESPREVRLWERNGRMISSRSDVPGLERTAISASGTVACPTESAGWCLRSLRGAPDVPIDHRGADWVGAVPDGVQYLSRSRAELRLWSTRGELLGSQPIEVRGIDFGRDMRCVFLGSRRSGWFRWSLEDPRSCLALDTDGQPIAFCDDGQRVLVRHEGGRLTLGRFGEPGEQPLDIKGAQRAPMGKTRAARFRPGSRDGAVLTEDGALWTFDESGEAAVLALPAGARLFDYATDGRLVVALETGQLNIFDRDLSLIDAIDGQEPAIELTFAPGGLSIAVGIDGKRAVLYPGSREDLLRLAERRATRQLSAEERQLYGVD